MTMRPPTPAVILAVSFCALAVTQADESSKAGAPAPDSMQGKEAGEVRDDNGLKMKMVWCPPGTFTMGWITGAAGRVNGDNRVEVTLTRGFWLGRTEVTQAQWESVMKSRPWQGRDFTREGAENPAAYVDWNDAADFCRKFTELERQGVRLSADWEYVLPTSAQWERACRAGTTTMFSFGDDESKLGEYAWFSENTISEGQWAREVGQKKPNGWGIFDMHGNVWEWCRDFAHGNPPGGRDPGLFNDDKTKERVFRGGSYLSGAEMCRSTHHYSGRPSYRHSDVGFRVALVPVQLAK
jgi:formylglycine-generating enzyme required for sulfatase activity